MKTTRGERNCPGPSRCVATIPTSWWTGASRASRDRRTSDVWGSITDAWPGSHARLGLSSAADPSGGTGVRDPQRQCSRSPVYYWGVTRTR